MISFDGIKKTEIRNHYELATLFYRLVWGVHIHHGLWNGEMSSRQAQHQLIEHLLEESEIPRGASVIDVGCGMGGSSIHLARHHDCNVTGITLSSVQRTWAGSSALLKGVGAKTRFLRQDAETAEFEDESFDYLWSIECTEHLFDKRAFFQRAARWVRSGGGAALCIWLAGDEPHTADDVRQVKAVCDAFLCPSLGTVADYSHWLDDAGLEVTQVSDLTSRVDRTWEICTQRLERSGLGKLSRICGRNMLHFVESFETLLNAYRSGAMKYCSITAKKR
jgi:tocopherol O-methyltransferase